MSLKCPLCNKSNNNKIYYQKNSVLARYGFLNKKPKKLSKISDLTLNINYCEECDFAWNTTFDYNKIKYDSDAIIESGIFSKRYLEYQRNIAHYLKKIIGYQPEVVVEIGAGSGLFLKEFDAKKKIAIEPSNESIQIDKSIKVYNDFYKKEKFNFKADIIVLRQVLEHVNNPKQFITDIISSFRIEKSKEFLIYIEVPNSIPTFRFGRFYDLYYEHCNYFTTNSLMKLSTILGMRIIDFSSAMDGELISILMRFGPCRSKIIESNFRFNKEKLENKLRKSYKLGKKIFGWGASGNGVQILNSLKINSKIITCIIDSDINKQGKIIPGTHQEIISPSQAVALNPEIIIILTQFHKKEIFEQCKELFKKVDIWYV